MKIDRLMNIIVVLLNQKKITAKELAEKFEVSVRTIYRDIDTIDMAGIPIISYPGVNGGFGIMENYKLNNQLLTINNLCSILTTLNGINHSLEDKDIDASIEKFRSLIPNDQKNYLELQMDQLVIDMPSWAKSKKEKERIKIIREAINLSKLITISYHNYNNEFSRRTIEPISIIFKGYTWHLFAYCLNKDDYRLFRITRIKDLVLNEDTFERRKMTYREYDESKVQVKTNHVTLKFSPHVRSRVEDIFNDDDLQILNTNEIVVTSEFPESEWFYSLILSFGEHVEVLGPQLIRETIANRIKQQYEKYL